MFQAALVGLAIGRTRPVSRHVARSRHVQLEENREWSLYREYHELDDVPVYFCMVTRGDVETKFV